MAYSSNEVKSGLLITVCLVLLFALTFVVGGFTTGATKAYQVRFGYISGLEDNAPVYFSGREVGKVNAIEVLRGEERPIQVTIQVADGVELREQSEAYVDNLGLMGEKFIELSQGPLEAPILEAGGVISGTDPIPTHLLIHKMNVMSDNFEELHAAMEPMVENVGDVLSESKEDVTRMLANFRATSDNLREMTADLKRRPWRLVRKGKPNPDQEEDE
jgi:phospholipid/cholesterol/gamma-HCH transport system substrate-binding protein